MYICVDIYTYIFIYVYTVYAYISMYVCVCICIHIYLCAYVYVCMYVLYVYVQMCASQVGSLTMPHLFSPLASNSGPCAQSLPRELKDTFLI